MYLDHITDLITKHLPAHRLPSGDSSGLLRIYAMLLRAKGASVTEADVHDAWSVWMADRDPTHKSLVPYDELSEEIRDEDRVFATAIRSAADELKRNGALPPTFEEVLFPPEPPKPDAPGPQVLELYKIIVGSSEALVGRRQAVNTFFLTINGALLTAYGLVAQNIGTYRVSGAALIVIAAAGAILCLAWRSLITSFGQLNRGKFKVINTIERHLPLAVYAAEWEALGRGENPKIYRSFTSREIWVPTALLAMHALAAVIAIFVLLGHSAGTSQDSTPTTAPATQPYPSAAQDSRSTHTASPTTAPFPTSSMVRPSLH